MTRQSALLWVLIVATDLVTQIILFSFVFGNDLIFKQIALDPHQIITFSRIWKSSLLLGKPFFLFIYKGNRQICTQCHNRREKKPVGASYQQTILYLCEIDVVAIVIFVLIAILPRKVTAVVEFAVAVVQTGNGNI